MNIRSLGSSVLLASFIVGIALDSNAQANKPRFRVLETQYKSQQTPESFENTLVQIVKSPEGQAVAGAAVALAGGDPSLVIAVSNLIPPVQHQGEETTGELDFGMSGYALCRVDGVGIASERRSSIGSAIGNQGLAIYIHFPREQLGGSRTWLDLNLIMTWVRSDLRAQEISSGRCLPPPTAKELIYVR